MNQLRLEPRLQREDSQALVLVAVLLADGAGQPLPHQLGQAPQLTRVPGVVAQGFQDQFQVANRHLLGQQPAQHLVQQARCHHARHQLIDQPGGPAPQRVEQLVHLLPGQQFGGMGPRHPGQVPGNHFDRLEHLVPQHHRLVPQPGLDPARGLARRRIDRRNSGNRRECLGPLHRQQQLGPHLAPRHGDLVNSNPVLLAVEFQVVANLDPRQQRSHGQRQVPSRLGQSAQQRLRSGRRGERQQFETQFQFQWLGKQPVFFVRGGGPRSGRSRLPPSLFVRLARRESRLVATVPRLHLRRGEQQAPGQAEQGNLRQPGEGESRQQQGRDHQRLGPQQDLRHHLARQVGFHRRPGRQQGRRQRDQERRQLGHQSVANGQLTVDLDRFAHRESVLKDPQGQPPHQVDRGDQQARDGVPFHEAAGTIHRPVEVGLSRQLLAAVCRFRRGDAARLQIGVNRQLPPGEPIEGEAGRDLANAGRTLVHNHHLHNQQHEEQDQADAQLSPRHELPERFDHRARRLRPRFARFRQDEAGRGDVQHQPVQGRHQQQGRKHAEFQRMPDSQRGQQHQHRRRDVRRERQVQQPRRQRHHQHHHAEHQQDGQRQARGLRLHVGGGGGGDRNSHACDR